MDAVDAAAAAATHAWLIATLTEIHVAAESAVTAVL